MCGIAGFISPHVPALRREEAVARMSAAMVHRGPDDAGLGSWSEATLGMRRLAIFDPANGHQPMSSPDGRRHLVFNGAIYNHQALRAELATAWEFHTHCDTEVLLAALTLWGERALSRLRGMFAFAFWDDDRRTLLVARDPLGIKPLYYRAAPDGSLLFASEIQALCAAGSTHVSTEIDPAAVSAYLAYLAVPAPLSLYRGIHCLRPGERLTWREGRTETAMYWKLGDGLDGRRPSPCHSPEEFSVELRAQLEDTVRAHVLADVPVGAFLSGGLDSTLITALMTKLGSGRLKTFSIGFAETGFSEADDAAANARYLSTEHHPFLLTGAQVAADIERIVAALDQPTGDGVNTYYASQAAKAGGVTAALSGLGADELFGGYPSFQRAPSLARARQIFAALPRPLRDSLTRLGNTGGPGWRKLADTLRHGHSPAALALAQRRLFSDATAARLLVPGLEIPTHPALASLEAELQGTGLLGMTGAAELRGYMTDVLLRDSDVMSMRHSLELRVPFVDVPLVAWAMAQPDALRFDPRLPKGALIAATRDLLPPELLTRKKRGFTLPFPLWMRKELRPFLDHTFSPAALAAQPFIRPAGARALWQSFLAGGDDREWSRVWSLAMLLATLSRPRLSV